jgi:hypothetical protein
VEASIAPEDDVARRALDDRLQAVTAERPQIDARDPACVVGPQRAGQECAIEVRVEGKHKHATGVGPKRTHDREEVAPLGIARDRKQLLELIDDQQQRGRGRMPRQQLPDRGSGLGHAAIERSGEPFEWPLAGPEASYEEARQAKGAPREARDQAAPISDDLPDPEAPMT